MNKGVLFFTIVLSVLSVLCQKRENHIGGVDTDLSLNTVALLRDSLDGITDSYPAEIGIALITDIGDTIVVNNVSQYPMMSVFKLHQAISLCDLLSRTGKPLDTVVSINRSRLNPDTWSPMLKDHTDKIIVLPISKLLDYTLTLSDNNASNWMFENLQSIQDADRFIATIIPRESFSISYTEAEMANDHSLAYSNRTSPLGAAILIDRLYNDSILSPTYASFIRNTLDDCKTGQDRLVAPLKDKEGIIIGHKTGSGYRNENGILAANNDVGFIRLPNGRHYTLAIFVKDFQGSEEEAAEAIARISETVYKAILEEIVSSER